MENKFLWPFLLLILTLFLVSFLLQQTAGAEVIHYVMNKV